MGRPEQTIDISTYNYPLPEERIARFPLEQREASKLLVLRGSAVPAESVFRDLPSLLPPGALVAFNDTKVIRARLIFHKESGGRIEIFCLEPHAPADYERAFASVGHCEWRCIVGGAKKWKQGKLKIEYSRGTLEAEQITENKDIISFTWSGDLTFGQLLEQLGRTPIPPYLRRESEAIDTERYQTVYSQWEGSVAAPTAGLHFTEELLEGLTQKAKVTLHVGAGTFLPVKSKDARDHAMHTEFFDVALAELERIATQAGNIIAVGTTTVRTLESLAMLGERVLRTGNADPETPVGQWEPYADGIPEGNPLEALAGWMHAQSMERLYGSTRIMITPAGYRWRTIRGLITNFHQPQSTLLLLVSALIGERWHDVYTYALEHDFRFLSYGDSSLLLPFEK